MNVGYSHLWWMWR